MKKGKKTSRKNAVGVVKKRDSKKDTFYTYDTKMSVLEKKLNLDFDIDPNTKLGDFFNERGYRSLVRVLQML